MKNNYYKNFDFIISSIIILVYFNNLKNDMFKKWILVVLSVALVSSCMWTKNETPENVLMLNQTSLIEKIEKYSYPVPIWEVDTIADIAVNSDEWNANISIKSNFDFDKLKESFTWDMNWNMEIMSEDVSWSWFINMSMIMDKKIFYTKLNDMDLYLPWEQWVDMIKMMASAYIWKWIAIDLWNDDLNLWTTLINSQDMLDVYKKYPVLKLVKENEDTEYYNYDVVLNNENIIKISQELADLEDNKITDEDVVYLNEELDKIDFTWNIKIDPKKKEYFVFSWKVDDMTFAITNNKSDFLVKVSWGWWELSSDFKKTTSWAIGTVIVMDEWKEELNADLEITYSSKDLNMSWKISFEEAEVQFDIKNKFKSKSSIEVIVPEEFIKIQELIQWFMGWMLWGWASSTFDDSWDKDLPFELDNWLESNSNLDAEVQVNIDELKKDLENSGVEVNENQVNLDQAMDLKGIENLLK